MRRDGARTTQAPKNQHQQQSILTTTDEIGGFMLDFNFILLVE